MKKLISTMLVLSLILTLVPVTAKAENPFVQTDYTADPAPMVYNDVLYVYSSHDEDEIIDNFYTMFNWKCFSTTDMVNWTHHGTIANNKTFAWADNRSWAPQCIERDGLFYLYVPIRKTNGGMVIGVAVSESPTGPFEDAIGAPLVDDGSWDNIDPTVYVDDKGDAYLYFGNPRLRYVKLNDDMLSYDKSIGIVDIPMTTDSFGDNNGKSAYAEGPWFYQRDGLYYMVYPSFGSDGGSKGGEYIGYSTSTSPTGPWEYRGVVMKSTGCYTNHPGMIDYKGNSYFFYHTADLPGGGSYHRSIAVEQFAYNDDGSIPEIEPTKEGPDAIDTLNPYNRVEAETIAKSEGVKVDPCVNGGMSVTKIHDGDYIKVRNVDFGSKNAINFTANVASINDNSSIEVRKDSIDGDLIGTLSISNTGGEDAFQSLTIPVNNAIGVCDLYLVFKGDTDEELFIFDYWQFEKEEDPLPTPDITVTASPAVTNTPLPSSNVSTPTTAPVAEKVSVPKVKNVKLSKKAKQKLLIKFSKVSGRAGYQIEYSTNKKFTKNLKKISSKKTSVSTSKLKKNKTYFVRVRAFKLDSKGEKVYGKYSATKHFKF